MAQECTPPPHSLALVLFSRGTNNKRLKDRRASDGCVQLVTKGLCVELRRGDGHCISFRGGCRVGQVSVAGFLPPLRYVSVCRRSLPRIPRWNSGPVWTSVCARPVTRHCHTLLPIATNQFIIDLALPHTHLPLAGEVYTGLRT